MSKDLVVKNANTILALVEDPKHKKAISDAIPKQAGLEPAQFLRVMLTTLRTNPKLLECTPESVISGMLRAAGDGFMLDPGMGLAYLVPFRNNKTGTVEAQYIRGYRGLISLMTRYGEVKFVTAHVVYEQDTFDIEYGQNERLVHKPHMGGEDKGAAIGAYAVAHFKNGESTFVWMSMEEIEKIRKTSKTYSKKDKRNFGPWNDWTEAMQRKCPVRQLHKFLPVTPDLMKFHQAAAEDEAEELNYKVSALPEPERGEITDALTPGEPKAEPETAPEPPPKVGKKKATTKKAETATKQKSPPTQPVLTPEQPIDPAAETEAKRKELEDILNKRFGSDEERGTFLNSCASEKDINKLSLDDIQAAIDILTE
jgi:recombination protein RecT